MNTEASILEDLKEEISKEEEYELGLENGPSEDYKVIDDDHANYILKQIAEIEQEEDRINNVCKSEIEKTTQRINTYREKQLKTLDGTKKYLSSLLEAYAKGKLDGSKKKTYSLPYGSLSFKKSQDSYSYDNTVLLNYLKDNKLTQFIDVKESSKNGEIKKALEVKDGIPYLNGQPVEGISITPGELKFSVRIK